MTIPKLGDTTWFDRLATGLPIVAAFSGLAAGVLALSNQDACAAVLGITASLASGAASLPRIARPKYGMRKSEIGSTLLPTPKRISAMDSESKNFKLTHYPGPLVEYPHGGFKASGFGRNRSLHAIDNYADLKSGLLRSNPPR